MSESWFYHISQEGKLSRVATDDAALASAKDGGFLWLHYCQPTKEELSKLIDPLGLHPLSIEDCLDENQIPKIEDFPQNTFIIFSVFDYSNRKLSIGEIDLFIGGNFLVTVSQRDSRNRSILDGIEHIVEMDIESARHGPAFLMHVILDHVVDQKFLAIEAFEDELDAIEEALLAPTTTCSSGLRREDDDGTGVYWDNGDATKLIRSSGQGLMPTAQFFGQQNNLI